MQVQSLKDFFKLLARLAVELGVRVLVAVVDVGQGDHVEAVVQSGINQVRVHGKLDGVSFPKGGNAVRLASVGQLVGKAVHQHGDFSPGGLLHKGCKVAACLCPGAGLSR